MFPKNENLILFSAWNGRRYSDNTRSIFEYALENRTDFNVCWLVKDKPLYTELVKKGIPVAYAYSCQGVYFQLRAKVIVYTHSIDWEYMSYLINGNTKKVQTWHAIPMKHIGLDDKRIVRNKNREFILNLLFLYRNEKHDLVLANGDFDSEICVTAFNIEPENIKITGYPKHDEIINSIKDNGLTNKVVYMPTFRGEPYTDFKLFEQIDTDFISINNRLQELDVELHIRLHPVNSFKTEDLMMINSLSNIYTDKGGEFSVNDYDVLITDFSGAFFEFMLTNKPIIMAPFNLEQYLEKDRKLYYEYSYFAPLEVCQNWEEVINQIHNIKHGDYCMDKYFSLKSKFHKYTDSNSSERAFSEIIKLCESKVE